MLRQRPSGSAYPNSGAPANYYGGYSGGGGHGNGSSNGGGYGAPQYSYGGYSGGGGDSGYGGSTDSASSSDDKYAKKSRGGFALGGNVILGICVLLGVWTLIVFGLWWGVSAQHKSILKSLNAPDADSVVDLFRDLKSDLSKAKREKDSKVRETNRQYTSQVNQLERDNRFLQKERDELRVKYEGPDKQEEEARVLLREQAFQDQVAMLEEAIRKEAKRNVLERFGPEPHEVTMFVKFKGEILDFGIEMAALDDVPHATQLFLEQVDHGLWNGTYFYLNGPHIIQAGPQLSEEDEANMPESEDLDRAAAMKPFRLAGLDQLAFPDYSHNFPHLPWTLGFTGRPGGPDFYINKVDNSDSHGPGGQYQHALEEQGDSCFGIITTNRQNAAKLFTQEIYSDQSEWHYFLTEPVEIVGAVVSSKQLMDEPVPPANNADKSATDKQQGGNSDPVQELADKLKRKPRLPKIQHATEA